MNTTKNILAIATLALFGGTAMADVRSTGYVPAGQGVIDDVPARSSQLSRDDMNRKVAQARFDGTLVPAGQGVFGDHPSTTSIVARASVKQDVVRARLAGELVPAGEGPVEPQRLARNGSAREFPVAFARR